jgi:hypothetical protein
MREARTRLSDVNGPFRVASVQPAAQVRQRLAAAAVCGALALLALQALAAARLELTFDEAYYFQWSRALAFGYLDHPPMVALFIRASTAPFGESELGIRALSMLLAGALPALIAWMAWRLFRSVETAAVAVLLWIAMPLVMAGGVFVTPDAPLVVFWTLGLAAFVELWRTGKPGWLLALGLCLGLALQSKFTAFFFGAGVGLACLTTPSLRRWFASPWAYVGAALAALVFAPFVAWNAAHGWATFLKQFGRAPPHGFEPGYIVEFLVAQIGLMNPLVFAAFAPALVAVRWRGPVEAGSPGEARRLLVSTIAPAGLYFLLHALHDRVQGNWLAPLFPACALLAADWVVGVWTRGASGLPRWVAVGAVRVAAPAALVGMALAYVQATTGILPLGAADPTARMEGFGDLAREIDVRARAEGAPYVLTQGYGLTALLQYYGDGSVPIIQPEQRLRWIAQPPPPEALLAAPGLALGEAGRNFGPLMEVRYRSVEPLGALVRSRDGRPIQTYELFRVADPYAPVLDPQCVSVDVVYRWRPQGFARECAGGEFPARGG